MIKIFLAFTVLLIFACSPIKIEVRQRITGYYYDASSKNQKYRFYPDGTLMYFVKMTRYERRWKINETTINDERVAFLRMETKDGEHIHTYVPFFEGDTVRLEGVTGDSMVLVRIE